MRELAFPSRMVTHEQVEGNLKEILMEHDPLQREPFRDDTF